MVWRHIFSWEMEDAPGTPTERVPHPPEVVARFQQLVDEAVALHHIEPTYLYNDSSSWTGLQVGVTTYSGRINKSSYPNVTCFTQEEAVEGLEQLRQYDVHWRTGQAYEPGVTQDSMSSYLDVSQLARLLGRDPEQTKQWVATGE